MPEQTSPQQPSDDAAQPANQVQNATAEQVARFVTTIKNVEQQVGEHVIAALQHQQTVAVLTSVVTGPGGQQHIVSAALDPSQMQMVNQLLAGAAQTREEETMCVGFHCLLKPKKGQSPGDNAGQ